MITVKNSMHAYARFGKSVIIVGIGTFLSHCVITILNMYIFQKPPEAGFIKDYFSHLLSYNMIPTLITYGFFLTIAYYYFCKTKKVMCILNQLELKKVRIRTVLKTSQNITGTIIDHISVYNSEIIEWLKQKEERGETPPKKIKDASRNIGICLITLSQKSFLFPYIDSDNLNYDDLTTSLGKNLFEEND